MYKKIVSKDFFRKNPYKEFTTQRYVYTLLSYEGFEEKAGELLAEYMPERVDDARAKRQIIENEDSPEAILRLLRKHTDTMNQTVLCNKAMQFQDEIMPSVLEMLKRSYNVYLIENAIRVLRNCKQEYADRIMEIYDDARNPYLQSLLCIVLGFRGYEESIPWMYDRYMELKRKYPEEDYAEGPLLALHELNARFYVDP